MTYAGTIANYHAADNNASFKFNQRMTSVTVDNGKNFEIMVPLKHLSNFWRTLEMLLINCETNLILTWSDKCVLSNDTKATTFAITDTKLYVPVITLSTQDSTKLSQQLKPGFKRSINWNRHQPKVSSKISNQYLDS